VIRFGKLRMRELRAYARLEGRSELAAFVRNYMSAREHKAVRQIQRQMQSQLEQP
jgi:hypothetical protein